MVAFNINLAGGTYGHATALAFYRQFIHAANFHHVEIHIGGSHEFMGLAIPVDDGYTDFIFHGAKIPSRTDMPILIFLILAACSRFQTGSCRCALEFLVMMR